MHSEDSLIKTDGTMLYDPPSGWMYGFPKPYKPLRPEESIEETLARDGYPKKMMELAKWTRFIG